MTDEEIYAVAEKHFNVYETTIYAAAEHNSVDITPDLFAFAKELLSRAIPEGHVVVPKEPTAEMSAKGGLSVLRGYYSGMKEPDSDDIATAENAYSAMIAAAPANKEVT